MNTSFIAVEQDSASDKITASSIGCDQLPFILTKRDLAGVLRCTERHVDNLSRRGVLPSLRLGRSVRFRRDAVIASIRKLEGGENA